MDDVSKDSGLDGTVGEVRDGAVGEVRGVSVGPAPRLAAGLLGVFAVANFLLGLVLPGFDLNHWWLDVRPLPMWLGSLLSAGTGALLVAWALWPVASNWRRRSTQVLMWLLLAASVWDSLAFWGLLALGAITSGFPIPLSLLVGGFLGWLLWSMQRVKVSAKPGRQWLRVAGAVVLVVMIPIVFPVAQMFCFGKTDYRRKADAAVVLGAAVWPGNRPSHALYDRVMTGVDLYRQGYVSKLIMSGGPSGTPKIKHETEIMRQLAIDSGVPEDAIIVDALGVNTEATAANMVSIARENNINSILAVSHFYHLPRIQLSFQRVGLTVYTVPAVETYLLYKLPYYMAREVLALWYYYLKPLWK